MLFILAFLAVVGFGVYFFNQTTKTIAGTKPEGPMKTDAANCPTAAQMSDSMVRLADKLHQARPSASEVPTARQMTPEEVLLAEKKVAREEARDALTARQLTKDDVLRSTTLLN
ncbi:hypothetical protein M3Y94_00999800 [Aphelenchoides besseyi]|nr:hypothetical protein M3Y94_00999800 [Aphelenchoides besseyi]KAI6221245.1 hypothetical protein M3Y95_01019900 [Aphelenchoides besseyi]